MNFGLTKSDLNYITKTLKQFPEIESTFIFGSRAMGNFKPASDIDLCLKGKNITIDTNIFSKEDRVSFLSDANYLGEKLPFYNKKMPEGEEEKKEKKGFLYAPIKHDATVFKKKKNGKKLLPVDDSHLSILLTHCFKF